MTRIIATALIVASGVAQAENWPGFRGPGRQGVSTETGLPLKWSTTENIAWQTDIPGLGWSSPIVWGDRIFLTTATDDGASAHVLALDAKSGKILWDREVLKQELKRKEKRNSYATPTPVTDGKQVYAVFGDGSIVAHDFSGKVLWTNRDYPYYSQHGIGASPVLYRDLLIMPYDASNEGEDKKVGWQKPWDRSFIVGIDVKTGKQRWKGTRGLSRIGHVTPNFATVNGKVQLVSGAGDVIQGFDPATGERLWSVPSQGEGVVPSIVIGDGLAFTSSGFEKTTMRAVRLGATPAVAWEQTKSVSHIPSFLYVRPRLFSVTEAGVAMAVKAESGDIVWQERLGGEHFASPVYADGRIYFLSDTCETAVIAPGDKLEVLARNQLEGQCQASMAISGKRLFIRTANRLYCIGK